MNRELFSTCNTIPQTLHTLSCLMQLNTNMKIAEYVHVKFGVWFHGLSFWNIDWNSFLMLREKPPHSKCNDDGRWLVCECLQLRIRFVWIAE
jgi:hypothetical protein